MFAVLLGSFLGNYTQSSLKSALGLPPEVLWTAWLQVAVYVMLRICSSRLWFGDGNTQIACFWFCFLYILSELFALFKISCRRFSLRCSWGLQVGLIQPVSRCRCGLVRYLLLVPFFRPFHESKTRNPRMGFCAPPEGGSTRNVTNLTLRVFAWFLKKKKKKHTSGKLQSSAVHPSLAQVSSAQCIVMTGVKFSRGLKHKPDFLPA